MKIHFDKPDIHKVLSQYFYNVGDYKKNCPSGFPFTQKNKLRRFFQNLEANSTIRPLLKDVEDFFLTQKTILTKEHLSRRVIPI